MTQVYQGKCRRTRVAWAASIRWSTRCLLLVLLVWPCLRAFGTALTPAQEELIQVLFGDLEDPGDLDANGDGALTVADILLLGPEVSPTPTPTPVGQLFSGVISDLIPHAVGDRLVYRVTDPMGRISTETTLVTSQDGAGGFAIDVRAVRGQEITKHEVQSYLDTGTDLFFGGATDVFRDLATLCSPPLLRLKVPVIAQETFSTSVRCNVRIVSRDIPVGFIDRIDTFTPIDRVDSVTVPAGTYTQVLHIRGSTNFSGDVEDNEIYIAPGIGPILQIATAGGQVTRRELIDGTVGGQSVLR